MYIDEDILIRFELKEDFDKGCFNLCIKEINSKFKNWLLAPDKDKTPLYVFNFSNKKVKLVGSWPECFIDCDRITIYFISWSDQCGITSTGDNKIMYLGIDIGTNNILYFDKFKLGLTNEEIKIQKRNILLAINLLKNKYLESA